jgi:hypothetical protein
MKVRYSPQARDDLQDIFHYLDERSPSGAENVMRAIYAEEIYSTPAPRCRSASICSRVPPPNRAR